MEAKSRECRLAIFSPLPALAVSIVPASDAGKIGLCVEVNDLLSFQYMSSSTYLTTYMVDFVEMSRSSRTKNFTLYDV
jgi:hypothetical protein